MAKNKRSKASKASKAGSKANSARKRGAGEPKRSQSGGAVKGRIPRGGGTNAMDFETGVGTVGQPQFMIAKKRKKKKLSKKGKSVVTPVASNRRR